MVKRARQLTQSLANQMRKETRLVYCGDDRPSIGKVTFLDLSGKVFKRPLGFLHPVGCPPVNEMLI